MARALIMNCYADYFEENKNNVVIKYKSKHKKTLGINEHSVVVWDALYKRDFLINNNIYFEQSLVHEDIPFTAKVTYYANKITPVNGTFYMHLCGVSNSLGGGGSFFNVMSSINATHIAIDFINSVHYKKKSDYIGAISRCFWRYNDVFRKLLTRFPDDFDIIMQKKLFLIFSKDFKDSKYQRIFCKDCLLYQILKNGNFDLYVSYINKKDKYKHHTFFWHVLHMKF